ncbi:RNA polymerase subunit sigma-24 [Cohnella kolymensis]|uniref:RNA polymerase subunit sigma-24 n=1 Tax=Cohnella kolymensis TaxID=1590652 RepID=A0ABR5A750_9BACL|nr:RNA polymerase sigma factor [Cohnella kolymensis]KIL36237.1 RNA polymerase subunit sigma-24 [Cohnella kolymensis]
MENELIQRMKAGDRQEAFEQLYRLYADQAIRTAAAITLNQASAADVVQETFIRVYRNIENYDIGKPFKPWFNRILMNECNRYLKKHSRVIPSEIDEERDLPSDTDTYDFDRHGEIYELVQQLDDIHRVPVILKYLNDLADQDIADILGLNLNTVKSRLFKARNKLRGWMTTSKGGSIHGA